MRKLYLALPLFLFLFVIISMPAYAGYNPDISLTTNYGLNVPVKGIDCINATTNDIYCYIFTPNNIYKYNESFIEVDSCSFNSGGCTGSYKTCVGWGFVVLNETTAITKNTTTMMFVNLTSMGCNILAEYKTGSDWWSHFVTDAGTYVNTRGSYSEGEIYTIRSYFDYALSYQRSAYTLPYRALVSLPDKTDNSTLYAGQNYVSIAGCINPGGIEKYVDGVLVFDYGGVTGYMNDIPNTNKSVYFDFIRIDGNDYAYVVDDKNTDCDGAEGDDLLQRYDWTEVEGGGVQPTFYPNYPLNNSILSYTTLPANLNLRLVLNSTNDGVIYWWYDNAFLGTSIYNRSNSDNYIYTNSKLLTAKTDEGLHNWSAMFLDNNSVLWYFGDYEQHFTIVIGVTTINDLFENPANTISFLIGDWFGADNEADQKNISALLLSLFGALALMLVSVKFANVKGAMAGTTFIVSLLVLFVFFTTLGWLNPVIMILLVIVAGFFIAKQIGVLGGG